MTRYWLVLAFQTLFFIDLVSQDRNKADSLEARLTEKSFKSNLEKAEILADLVELSVEPERILHFSKQLIEIKDLPDRRQHIRAYIASAVALRMQGKLNESITHILKASVLAKEEGHSELLAESFLELGTTYTSNDDYTNALIYYNTAIAIFRSENKKQELAINLLNTGYTYYEMSLMDTALLYYNEAEPIFDSLGLTIGSAYTLGNRALVYKRQGKEDIAERDLLAAIKMLSTLGDQFGMADYHNQLGNLYLEQGRRDKSIDHLQQGLSMALDLDLKEQIRDASLALAILHGENENYAVAYTYHRQYVAFRDSIQSKETTKRMADLRTEYEVNLREKEIDILERDKELQWVYILIAISFMAMFIVLFLLYRQRLLTQKMVVKNARESHQQEVQYLLAGQEKKALESMVLGRENERKRLAGELHNHLGSLLATVKMNLNGLKIEDKRVDTLHHLVDRAYTDIRELSHGLNMGVSDDFGLVPALKELVGHLNHTSNLEVELQVAVEALEIDLSNEIVIYRIVQELVSNILKHAKASKVTLLLTYFEDDELLNIMVTDNGKGFNIENYGKKSGIGLSGLQEMVEKLGGELDIDSQMNKGTTVNIDFPLVSDENGLST